MALSHETEVGVKEIPLGLLPQIYRLGSHAKVFGLRQASPYD
jgi:hypothetical protein